MRFVAILLNPEVSPTKIVVHVNFSRLFLRKQLGLLIDELVLRQTDG